MVESFFMRTVDSDNSINKISIIAFSFLAVLILLCSFLIYQGFYLQSLMLRSSGISYEQRILIEETGDKIYFIIDSGADEHTPDRVVHQARSEIKENAAKINESHEKLKQLLIQKNRLLYPLGSDIKNIQKELLAVDAMLEAFNKRIDTILSASIPMIRVGFDLWEPTDNLLFNDGPLFNAVSQLNQAIYQFSLKKNQTVYLLYGSLLLLLLAGMGLIWLLTFAPLNRKLRQKHQELSQKNLALEFQASHDTLTSTPGRSMFNGKMEALMFSSLRRSNTCLILLDIDNFKSINDNHGHHEGDEVLIFFSEQLKQFIENEHEEFIYRLSGDEFAIILQKVPNRAFICQRINQLIHRIRRENMTGIKLTCSIGVAWGERCGASLEEFFSAADAALYHVKQNGRNHFAFFSDVSPLSITESLQLELEMQRAIANEEFVVHYQPIVRTSGHEIVAFEALARWQHPEKGLLYPKEWLPLAERLSLLSQITTLVIKQIEKDYLRWLTIHDTPPLVSINITESMLISGTAVEQFSALLERNKGKKISLGVEVTESIMFDHALHTIREQLELLRGMSMEIALDDFGTGFANMSHLQTIPFDVLKIDYSFTSRIRVTDSSRIIVQSMIDLARAIGKKVVCEGVEDIETQTELREMGCQYAQGFLYSNALAHETATQFILKEKRLCPA